MCTAYTLERLDGLSTVLVDYVVPNGFPFETTSERNITLQEGALYFWQITDSSGDGLSVNDGGGRFVIGLLITNTLDQRHVSYCDI